MELLQSCTKPSSCPHTKFVVMGGMTTNYGATSDDKFGIIMTLTSSMTSKKHFPHYWPFAKWVEFPSLGIGNAEL